MMEVLSGEGVQVGCLRGFFMFVFVNDVSIFCKEAFFGCSYNYSPFFCEDKNHSLSEAIFGVRLAEVTPAVTCWPTF